eukprot:Pgem_evm2s2505
MFGSCKSLLKCQHNNLGFALAIKSARLVASFLSIAERVLSLDHSFKKPVKVSIAALGSSSSFCARNTDCKSLTPVLISVETAEEVDLEVLLSKDCKTSGSEASESEASAELSSI